MAPHQTSLPPGFRFHPTDVELVWYYLKRKIMGKPFRFEAISEVELYKFPPWDLPGKSCLRSNDLEWYFFCPRDRKYSHGSRTNRTTKTGFWKTTGRDRSIVHNSQTVGMKKTLIFHLGKAPQGSRTNWVMYEFRLESKALATAGYQQDAYVLCKIFEKSGAGPKTGEQYGAPFKEEDWEGDTDVFCPIPLQSIAPEVGKPSAMIGNFEVGEPSSVRELCAVGEISSMQSLYEVGEPSSIRELSAVELSSIQDDLEVEPSSLLDHSGVGDTSSMQVAEPSNVAEPYLDGFSLEQLQAFLNDSPPHSNTAYDKMLDAGILVVDIIQELDSDFQNIYGDLDDLSALPLPEQLTNENIVADSVTFGNDQGLHPVVAEFAKEHYVQISDIGFAGEGNPTELVAPGDCCRPCSNDTSSSGLNVYRHNVTDTDTVSLSELKGPTVAYGQLSPTSEVYVVPTGSPFAVEEENS